MVQEEAENLEKEAENVAKGTPTPPRGRPKRLAVRKLVLTPSEEFLRGPAVEAKKAVVTEPSPVETEKEAEEMAVEADVSHREKCRKMVEEEEAVEESLTGKNAEEMVEEEEAVEESPTEKNAEEMEMTDGTNKVRRDGTNEVRTGFNLRCKHKIMMYGKPRKVTAKKRCRPSKESAPVIACTPSEKRKPQWLQSPYTQVKTEDIDGPKKKRKTKGK
ncbi:hypothetical protein Bca52824_048118 [Brassica carinata]|uniref:Uncharacterized protein n=1 Tax=Brassica carinata TaxID=52824 RepID=A0A8X7RG16_BRACI|nr:hypothetical protein Bca52824_048118 [Brassica carinata]